MTLLADWSGRGEPALDEVLSDPIVRAMMRRDGLVRADVEKAAFAGAARQPLGDLDGSDLPPISA